MNSILGGRFVLPETEKRDQFIIIGGIMMKRKVWHILLTLCMVVAMMPAAAFAGRRWRN